MQSLRNFGFKESLIFNNSFQHSFHVHISHLLPVERSEDMAPWCYILFYFLKLLSTIYQQPSFCRLKTNLIFLYQLMRLQVRKNSQVFREINLYISDRMKNNLLWTTTTTKSQINMKKTKTVVSNCLPYKDQFACKKWLTPLGKWLVQSHS